MSSSCLSKSAKASKDVPISQHSNVWLFFLFNLAFSRVLDLALFAKLHLATLPSDNTPDHIQHARGEIPTGLHHTQSQPIGLHSLPTLVHHTSETKLHSRSSRNSRLKQGNTRPISVSERNTQQHISDSHTRVQCLVFIYIYIGERERERERQRERERETGATGRETVVACGGETTRPTAGFGPRSRRYCNTEATLSVTGQAPNERSLLKNPINTRAGLPLFAKDAFAYYPFIIVVCIAFGVSSFGVFAFLDYM